MASDGSCLGPKLPEDIWCHIHSLMSMRDAAQVACVSSAFARFWRCHPNLVFTEETLGLNENACDTAGNMTDFSVKVDHILKNHSGIGVKTFKLEVGLVCDRKGSCHLDHLDSWLQIAVKPGIEELILNLSSVNGMYNFPSSLLSGGTGDSLRYLFLASCCFSPTPRLGCLRSLTRIQLYMVHITENELSCFLSSCSGLQSLELRYCSTITGIRIPFLQQLSYLEVLTCTKLQMIESNAPNLSSIYFAGGLNVRLSLGATLQIRKFNMNCNGAPFYTRTEFPTSMPNLESLIIHSYTEMVNAPMMPSKFLHLKFLGIVLGGPNYEFFSLVSFFDASPFLETFILNIRRGNMAYVSIFADPSCLRMMPEHHHDKLKRVEIINFSSYESLIELACHILESTTSLERLILDTTYGIPRCCTTKSRKCYLMHRDALAEARRALLAVETYIKPKVPFTVELTALKPCSRCHAVEL